MEADRLICGTIHYVNYFQRWVFKVFAALSLLVFLLSVALSVRSQWVCGILDGDQTDNNGFCYGFVEIGGYQDGVRWREFRYNQSVPLQKLLTVEYRELSPAHGMDEFLWVNSFAGFAWRSRPDEGSIAFDPASGKYTTPFGLGPNSGATQSVPGYIYCLLIPWYVILALPSALPMIWIANYFRRSHRGNRGLCEHCGYDLRATPERCPECGKIVEEVI